MAIAISPNENFEVILEADKGRPESDQTKFTFRVPTGRDRLYINRHGRLAQTESGSIEEGCYEAVRATLVSVTPTLKDSAGRSYPLVTAQDGYIDHAWMGCLRMVDVMELGVQVLTRMQLDGADVEKSEPSPTDS